MALSKNNPTGRGTGKQPDSVHTKYVKAARMWCTTTILNGKQEQVWSTEKPE